MSGMRTFLVTTFCALLLETALVAAEVGKPSPALTIQRVNGPALQLSQYKGKVVAFVFIDTECPHCQRLTGLLNTIIKQFEGKPLQVVACAMNPQAPQRLPLFTQQFQPAFPVGYCTREQVYAYTGFSEASGKPFYVPHMVFLDRRGIVRGDYPGESDFMQKPDTNIPAKLDELLKAGTTSVAAGKQTTSPRP